MPRNWIELSVRFLVRAWGIRTTKDGMTRLILTRYREAGISIASASFELAKIPDIRLRADGAPSMDVAPMQRDAPAQH